MSCGNKIASNCFKIVSNCFNYQLVYGCLVPQFIFFIVNCIDKNNSFHVLYLRLARFPTRQLSHLQKY